MATKVEYAVIAALLAVGGIAACDSLTKKPSPLMEDVKILKDKYVLKELTMGDSVRYRDVFVDTETGHQYLHTPSGLVYRQPKIDLVKVK